MANANIPQIQSAITTMTNWITWATTQQEAEPGKMLGDKYAEFVAAQNLAKKIAQELLDIYTLKGIV